MTDSSSTRAPAPSADPGRDPMVAMTGITMEFPGVDNLLETDNGDFNDALLSFMCYEKK